MRQCATARYALETRFGGDNASQQTQIALEVVASFELETRHKLLWKLPRNALQTGFAHKHMPPKKQIASDAAARYALEPLVYKRGQAQKQHADAVTYMLW